MKRIMISVFFIGVLCGCKKGPNDPVISFRSRDNRITGDWELESAAIKMISRATSTGTEENNTFFENSTLTVVIVKNGTATSTSYPAKRYFHIEKDGTAATDEITEHTSGITYTNQMKGRWSWVDLHKNKAGILISQIGPPYAQFGDGIFTIDELRHDKLVLKRFRSTRSSSNIAGDVIDTEEDYTLTFKK